jgi:ketosteroid isomerase-like protein
MTDMRVLMCLAAVVMAPTIAWAQQLDSKKSADQVQRYLLALTTCQTQGLLDMIDPEVSSIGVRGAFAQSRQVYVQAVQAQCAMGVRLDLQSRILRHSEFGDIALSVLEMTGNSVVGAKSTPADLRVTLVLRRGTDGVWRILHTQTAAAF